eukprot:TRINITY_DN1096_c0_g1_i1.p1 TRINITY_DN1096_c0_g1~~TRINITY_DN1096_c0_g1_i1.p1  ORF type:complete len:420 (+),score=95.02 TRINITY_DN1096_c0_g1_i1:34-1260(+)
MTSLSREKYVQQTVRELMTPSIDPNEIKVLEKTLTSNMFDSKYSPDGKYFMAIDNTNSSILLVFDGETGEYIRTLSCHDHANIYSVAFSDDNRYLATASLNKDIVIYDMTNDFYIDHEYTDVDSIFSLVFSHSCDYLYYAGSGKVKKMDLRTKETVGQVEAHAGYICRLRISPDDRYVLSGGDDGTAKLFRTETMERVQTFEPMSGNVRGIDYHPNGHMIATGTCSPGKVSLWNTEDGSLVHTFSLPGEVHYLKFLLYKWILVLSGNDGFYLFDIDTFAKIQHVPCGASVSYFSFDVSPDLTKIIYGGDADQRIKMVTINLCSDETMKEQLLELSRPDGYVLSSLIAINNISPIRQLVAAGIYMNQHDYEMTINNCWDLVDINEKNGGNMHEFMSNFCDSGSSSSDDD